MEKEKRKIRKLLTSEPQNWKELESVADVFLKLQGFSTEKSIFLKGMRAQHQIDVSGILNQGAVKFTVIAECKFWNRKVGKAQIAQLVSVMEDIGASKGIIISKEGFEKGAQLFARKRSVQLLTTNHMMNEIRLAICRKHISNLLRRMLECETRNASKYGPEFWETTGLTKKQIEVFGEEGNRLRDYIYSRPRTWPVEYVHIRLFGEGPSSENVLSYFEYLKCVSKDILYLETSFERLFGWNHDTSYVV